MNTSLTPIAADDFGPAEARHLLWRAGFGAAPGQVKALAAMGRDGAVAHLADFASIDVSGMPTVEIDPDILRKLTADERKRFRSARENGDQDVLDERRRQNLEGRRADRKAFGELKAWWMRRMLDTPRPAEERLTLLWHGHFASSYRSVRDAYLMQQQNQLFRDNANGSFADLARGIVRDPAMIKYLNNDRNNKRKPNENLARELMELFTLGVGHYSEKDIKQGARALTGYSVDDNDFWFRKNQHDNEPKKILGKVGNFNGDDFVKILLANSACSKFVALKLYDYFVADVGDVYEAVPKQNRRVIDRLAARLKRSKYAIKPVLMDLFKSRHFYDPAIVGKKIKDPTQILVGTVRSVGTPTRSERALGRAMASMGQVLFEPPTVDGWDGGRLWINTSTLFVRQNLCSYLISGKHPEKRYNQKKLGYDPMALLEGMEDRSPAAVADALMDHLLGPHVSEARRGPVRRFMADRDQGVTRDGLVALLCLMTAMPEYQLC